MSVFCLGSEQIDGLWIHIEPLINRLSEFTGLFMPDALREDLKSAKRQLWGEQGDAVTYIVITEVYETPRGKTIELVGACGKYSEPVMDEIDRWARAIGGVRCRFGGRPGWARRRKEFTQVGIILEKAL